MTLDYDKMRPEWPEAAALGALVFVRADAASVVLDGMRGSLPWRLPSFEPGRSDEWTAEWVPPEFAVPEWQIDFL